MASKKKLAITLVRSYIGYSYRQRLVVKGLGLRRLRETVIRENTPSVQGMVRKISHLVKVEEVA
ncbi:MAG TPA: 50S ribosomal protein L30 [Nitrospiria bacterium]|jgi:large subunit ribosomal protein L30|nr:50S ribosomal protein L30 [Nitrospiria bacterium]